MTAPRWASALLARAARPDRREDVLGDLHEAHGRRLRDRGRWIAGLLTGLEALDVAAALLIERLRGRWTRKRAPDSPPATDRPGPGGPGFSWLDVKLGVRMLRKHPGLSIVGGLGMAVAIAVGAGFFAFFSSYLFPTIPLEAGDRMVGLENWDVARNNENRRSIHDFITWREEMTTVEDMTAFTTISRNLVTPGVGADLVRIAEMTPSGFQLARVAPLMGRYLLDSDAEEGADPVLVIGYDVWQDRYGGDPDIVGRVAYLGATAHEVVGVMPPGFAFPMEHDLWVPLGVDPSAFDRGAGPSIFISGRLAPGRTLKEANAEIATIGRRASAAYPDTHANFRPHVLPYTYPLIDINNPGGGILWEFAILQAIVSLLLVVVCVNVAVLVYARTATRQGEVAIRSALGASRRRIVLQLAVEALVLASAAALVGLGLAQVGLRLGHQIMEMEGGTPFWMDYGLNGATVLVVVALTLLAAFITGVFPALQATGRRAQATLRDMGGHTGLRLGKTWTTLVVLQVSVAVAGLPVAVAMGWRQIQTATTRPLYAAEEYLMVYTAADAEPPPGMSLEAYRAEIMKREPEFRDELVRQVRTEPGVSAVTLAMTVPGHGSRDRVQVEGLPSSDSGDEAWAVGMERVPPEYFETFRIPLLAGHTFGPADAEASIPPVVVSRSFVERAVPGGQALGRRIRTHPAPSANEEEKPGPWREIVGVVEDMEANPIDPELVEPAIYEPMKVEGLQAVYIFVRTEGVDGASLAGAIRRVSASIDPTMRVMTRPLSDLTRQEELAVQLVALVLGLVLASVLLLSAAGIYAMLSFTVTRRRREIGIRSALGAHPKRLLGGIFARAARQLGLGVALGMVAAVGLDRVAGGELLYGHGQALVPGTIALVLGVGLIAALGPARRGLGVQPAEALKSE